VTLFEFDRGGPSETRFVRFSLRDLRDLRVSAVKKQSKHSPRRRRERRGGAENFKLGTSRAGVSFVGRRRCKYTSLTLREYQAEHWSYVRPLCFGADHASQLQPHHFG